MNASTAPTLSNIRTCGHCGLPYDWRRSTSSSLKMTYCGTLCEKGDLGFTIETLLEAKAFRPAASAPAELEAVHSMVWEDLIAA